MTIERSLLKRLGGGCALPLGCVCHIMDDQAELRIFYASSSGEKHYKAKHTVPLSEIDPLLDHLTDELRSITTA